MDPLTPLLVLAVKIIMDTQTGNKSFGSLRIPGFPTFSPRPDKDKVPSTEKSSIVRPAPESVKTNQDKANEQPVDDKLIEAVVERIKSELPAIIEAINSSPSQTIVSETYDAVYTSQIAKAQEFLNENHSADLSRVKCLLHKLLPKEYFDLIEQLREHQDPQTVFNIHGGQNIIAPNAEKAEQHFKKK